MSENTLKFRSSAAFLQEIIKLATATLRYLDQAKATTTSDLHRKWTKTMAQPAIEMRRFEAPDQVLDMKDRGGISIIKMADGSTGMHAIFEPGWTWEMDEKPLLGSPDSCPMRHTGYCMSGSLVVRMLDTNIETRIGK